MNINSAKSPIMHLVQENACYQSVLRLGTHLLGREKVGRGDFALLWRKEELKLYWWCINNAAVLVNYREEPRVVT